MKEQCIQFLRYGWSVYLEEKQIPATSEAGPLIHSPTIEPLDHHQHSLLSLVGHMHRLVLNMVGVKKRQANKLIIFLKMYREQCGIMMCSDSLL